MDDVDPSGISSWISKLWDQLGFMAISGTSVIIIAILLGILHEIKHQTAMMDIHWSEDHEERTEIKYALIEIKDEISFKMDQSST